MGMQQLINRNSKWFMNTTGDAASRRRGTVTGLLAVILPVLVILAAFSINTAHMQLTRTELMVATDAAARAGGRAFSETQDVEAARAAAISTAALNTVSGMPLEIRGDDGAGEIEFGRSIQEGGGHGRFVFEKIPTHLVSSGAEIASSVRVLGRRDDSSLSGRVTFALPGVFDTTDFGLTQTAVAMQVDRDISLVLDRSGSMDSVIFNWPAGTNPFFLSTIQAGVDAGLIGYNAGGNYYYYMAGVTPSSYQQWAWQEHYELGPAPTTPWQDLESAVYAFLNVLETTPQEELVSVASYASNASLDLHLDDEYSNVRGAVSQLYPSGMTAIGRGMNEGIKTLLASGARPNASKTMVVMTDGMHNTGVDPVSVAQQLMSNYNLTIHTVTFGSGADHARMQNVANIGGGSYYHAASGAELIQVFEEIANNLPTILTK
ncbi:vWA domain-containing protein [Planctomycetaceae bacterium SH139]